jgi:iron complex transport system substrate-binding protein
MVSAASSNSALPVDIELTDGSGNRLSLPQPPARIVSAGRASSLVVNALYLFPKGRDRLVAFEGRYQSPLAEAFLPVVDPRLHQKTVLEENAGPEQIAPLKPDLVVLKSFMVDKLGTPLQMLDIPVVYVDLENPEQFYRDIRVMGQFLGSPDRAEQIVAFYQERVSRVERMVSSVADEDRPRVLVLQQTGKGSTLAFNVPPAGWLQTEMVEISGGQPVWLEASGPSGWAVVTFEQIAAWNPDQIYLISYKGDAGKLVQELKSDRKWRLLNATRSENLHAFPGDFYSWDQPDTRWVLGLEWLAAHIHPDLAGSIDIMAEVSLFFREMYGLPQQAIDENVFPVLNGDLP